MATSKKAQPNQDSNAVANDATMSSEGPSSEGKPKAFKLLGWRYFGLFKPRFKLGSKRQNSAYEKGYN